ncbi:MAG: hypothetical protein M3Y58_02575 [Chloroflexota bacterium]|nr:hypothetical protein [Chloroflexota bacterium]
MDGRKPDARGVALIVGARLWLRHGWKEKRVLREVLIILVMVVLGALAYGFVVAAERM